MDTMYRTAFIGCGKRAKAHAAGVEADGRLQVVALADVKLEAAKSMRDAFGFEGQLYTDYSAMLKREEPEVVISSLWTPLHLPVFKACADAGVKAVLSEKPMAPTWGACREMARIAEDTGCQLTFCHQRRFAEGNRKVREMIGEGLFGEILRMDLYSPPNLLDCGTHTFDQAFSFLEETPVKWVLGAVDATEPLNWFDVRSESMAVGTLVYENGVRATIQTGGPDMDMGTGVRVMGSGGFIEVYWDGEFGEAAIYDNPTWEPPALERGGRGYMMIDVVGDAVDALEGGTEPELSHTRALRASEVIFALYESVRRHRRIELPLEGVPDNPFVTMLDSGVFAEEAAAEGSAT